MSTIFKLTIASFFLLFSASSIAAPTLEITGNHYVNARSLQQETGSVSFKNTGSDPISHLSVTTDAKTLIINNTCQAGILSNQSCTITYTYTANQDVSDQHNGVTSQLENLQINYIQNKESQQASFYIVTSQVDSLRLLSLPMSNSNYHHIASTQTTELSYDETSHTIYLATQKGLSISNDGGNNWQTLTPFNSALNNGNNLEIGEFSPQFTYVNDNNLYVILSDLYHAHSSLMLSKDHGATWANLKKITRFTDFAARDNNLYLARDRFLDISHDGGRTWQTKSINEVIHSVMLDDNGVYLGTETGLLLSSDAGDHFQPVSLVPSICKSDHCSITKLKKIDNMIYALASDNYSPSQLIKGNSEGFQSLYTLDSSDTRNDYGIRDQFIIVGDFSTVSHISRDAGKSWSRIYPLSVALSSTEYNQIILFPQNNEIQIMLLSTDGYPLYSNDQGKSWVKILPSTVDRFHLASNKSRVLVLSLLSSQDAPWDTGFSKDNGLTWQSIASAFSDLSPDYVFGANTKFYYGSWESGGPYLVHSDENLNNWISVRAPAGITYPYLGTTGDTNGNLFTVVSEDRGLDTARIKVSNDEGKTWADYSPVVDDHCKNAFQIIPNIEGTILSASCYTSSIADINLYIQAPEKSADWKKVSFSNELVEGIVSEGMDIYLLGASPWKTGQPAILHVSHDFGNTWATQEIALPAEYRTMPYLLGLKAGKIYLALPSGEQGSRHLLEVSDNDGKSWKKLGSTVSSMYVTTGEYTIDQLVFGDNAIYLTGATGLYSIGGNTTQN
jgi:photosystem II stability/assembly factor-like uncharacterized protein